MQRFEQLKSIVDRIESNSELVAKLRVEANKESTQDGQQSTSTQCFMLVPYFERCVCGSVERYGMGGFFDKTVESC